MKPAITPKLSWHIFCKVVDNFGDIGVCWRLACNLVARGQHVRLWVDDASALAWMAPAGHPLIDIIHAAQGIGQAPSIVSTDVLIDAFDADFAINLIANYVINKGEMADINISKQAVHHNSHQAIRSASEPHPVWLNLEYLTAERFAERNHTLSRVHHDDAAAGWTQQYFYPGFTPKTGGLLREVNLFERQINFDRTAWLQQLYRTQAENHGRVPAKYCSKTQYISLFCYEPIALQALLEQLMTRSTPTSPICLLVTAGRATAAVKAILAAAPATHWDTHSNSHLISDYDAKNKPLPLYLMDSSLSILYLPTLSQDDYDHLLWSCDLNFVRGEDSLVRAIWAAKPFVWHIYPQTDGAHQAKLQAFLDMMDAPASLRLAHQAWNADVKTDVDGEVGVDTNTSKPNTGKANIAFPALDLPLWAQCAENLRHKLCQQTDLTTNLIDFVVKNR